MNILYVCVVHMDYELNWVELMIDKVYLYVNKLVYVAMSVR
jgi:hypothetical protein